MSVFEMRILNFDCGMVCFADNTKIKSDTSLFSEYRKERVARIGRESAKRQSIAAELALIGAMRAYAPRLAPPFRYTVNKYGKPYFDDKCGVYFSISHSCDLSACAVAHAPIGFDVQKITDRYIDVANRWFCKEEIEAVTDAAAFTRLWTRKEAVAKADGRGLGIGIEKINALNDEIICGSAVYDVFDIEAPSGYMAAAAVRRRALRKQ